MRSVSQQYQDNRFFKKHKLACILCWVDVSAKCLKVFKWINKNVILPGWPAVPVNSGQSQIHHACPGVLYNSLKNSNTP